MNVTELDPHKLDKLEISGFLLADAICGYAEGDHPISTISRAKAVTTLLHDIYGFYHKEKKVIPKLPFSTDEKHPDKQLGAFNTYLRRLSNYAKHGDSFTETTAQIEDWHSMISLFGTAIDYDNLIDSLLEHDIATVDECICLDTPLGAGTRTTLLVQALYNQANIYFKSLQHNGAFHKAVITDDNNELEHSQKVTLNRLSLSRAINENGLRRYDSNSGEIKLTNSQHGRVFEFTPNA